MVFARVLEASKVPEGLMQEALNIRGGHVAVVGDPRRRVVVDFRT